jgi:hypothetical protein
MPRNAIPVSEGSNFSFLESVQKDSGFHQSSNGCPTTALPQVKFPELEGDQLSLSKKDVKNSRELMSRPS